MFAYTIELSIIFKLRSYWAVFWKKIIEIFFPDRAVLFVSEKDLWLVNKLWIKRFAHTASTKRLIERATRITASQSQQL